MHSIKSFTSQEANKVLRRKGKLWFEDYFDRYIRNALHYKNAVAYIESNPAKPDCANRSPIGASAAPHVVQ
jgi:hypothetical protein